MYFFQKIIAGFLLVVFLFTLISAIIIDTNKSELKAQEDILFGTIEQKINALSPKEMIFTLDSLLSLPKIHPRVLAIVNKKISDDFKNYRPNNHKHPANFYYESWNTKNSHPYKDKLSEKDKIVQLTLLDKDECGYQTPFNGVITSGYGMRDKKMHNGVDLKLKTGDIVKAAFSGEVRLSRWQNGYGNTIIIRHYNGLETIYGHLSKRTVKSGDFVEAGQAIGKGGNTGRSRGSHLHLETRFKGKPINPEVFIDFSNNVLKSDTLILHKTKKGFRAHLPRSYINKILQNPHKIMMVYQDKLPLRISKDI